ASPSRRGGSSGRGGARRGVRGGKPWGGGVCRGAVKIQSHRRLLFDGPPQGRWKPAGRRTVVRGRSERRRCGNGRDGPFSAGSEARTVPSMRGLGRGSERFVNRAR